MGIQLRKITVSIKRRNLGIIVFFVFFYVFAWQFFTFKITQVPPGINGDEAAIGYNAALVAKNGHDQSGRFLPLFVSAFDLTDWKQPITFYSTVVAFRIFGPSYSLLREISVVFVLLSATLIYFLSKEIWGGKPAFLSLLIFVTIPAVLIQSHLALENIAPVPFTIFWLWMLVKYGKYFKTKHLLLSALSLGVGLFTYPGMRLIVPVFFSLSLGFIFYLNKDKSLKKRLSENLKFFVIVIIFPIFMYLVKNQYPAAILAYNRPHGITTYQQVILPFISSFDLSFLFIQGDSTPYHSTGKQGVFLLATLPLFAFGIWRIAQRKDPFLIFILFTFLLSPILYGLVSSVHRGSRLLVLLPTFTIISSVGLIELFKLKSVYKNPAIIIIFVLITLNYVDFTRDYFYDYPNRVKSEFAKPYQLIFERAAVLSKRQNLTPYIQLGFREQNSIAVDFFEQVYFPNKLKIWKNDQLLSSKSVTLSTDNSLKKEGITQLVNGEFSILINESNEQK